MPNSTSFITIKIDGNLHSTVKKILEKNEFKYKYPSVASFANEAIFDMLKSIKQRKIKLPW
jgi:hypothetical protein